tara:strand:+ start:330 stop:512 length:183 start_codon:yes stop_codon:yes gene_type:complete
MITGAENKAEEQLTDKITEIVNREILMRFPQTSGPVLRTQKDNKLWTDFVEKNKNGSTNP